MSRSRTMGCEEVVVRFELVTENWKLTSSVYMTRAGDEPARSFYTRETLLAFLLELAVDHRPTTRRRPERFAIVVERQTGNMQRVDATRRSDLDNDGDGAAVGGAFTERESAAAGKTRVCETFQHGAERIILQQRAHLFFEDGLRC